MVYQICRQCRSEFTTTPRWLNNYCGTCGSQKFILKAEGKEINLKLFNGKKNIIWEGKKWK
jgi:Zn finger protein HypA/HybF involved in hydrogenase expression